MKKILVTAFDAFGGAEVNCSYEILRCLPKNFKNLSIDVLQLPTIRYECFDTVQKYLKEHKVDYIISLGQGIQEEDVCLEKVAINLDDFRIADNGENQPIDEKIIEIGQTAYFSLFPLKRMLQTLKDNFISAKISYSAGTFVCNHLMYQLLYHYPKKATFIHIKKFDLADKEKIKMITNALLEAFCVIEEKEIVQVGGELQ